MIPIEFLLGLACLYGTQESCEKSGQGYSQYIGIDSKIQEFSSRHKSLSFAAGSIGALQKRKFHATLWVSPKGYIFDADAEAQPTDEKVVFLIRKEF